MLLKSAATLQLAVFALSRRCCFASAANTDGRVISTYSIAEEGNAPLAVLDRASGVAK